MHNAVEIQSPADIDLGCNAVIEASAGTGKTYTIERLIVRLILEKKVPLEQILAVTFTEKATGELRDRLRAHIRALSRSASIEAADRNRLKDALETFDNAGILTIHGFCHRILQQYAFENGEPFSSLVEDDAALYEKMLKEQMRSRWAAWFGEDLEAVLRASGFSGDEDAWMGEVMRLARAYRPQCGDLLLPVTTDDPRKDFRLHKDAIESALRKLTALVGHSDPARPEESAFAVAYGALGIRSTSLAPRMEKMIKPMLVLLGIYEKTGRIDDAAYALLMEGGNGQKDHFHWLAGASLKNYAARMPHLDAVIEMLESLRGKNDELLELLKAVTVRRLREDVAAYKRQRGLISFDDMVTLVDRALGQSPVLIEELRKRYAYALVDEFQDTDTAQWDIFRKIFLESDCHRLFIIGDPKQAIYSFRGADVHAYIDARDQMRAAYGARSYALAVNWRSMPPLIDAFNRLFGEGGWFPEEAIGYLAVRPPDMTGRRTRLYRDATGRAAITAVDLDGQKSGTAAHARMAAFTVREIARLLDPGNARLVIDRDGVAGPLVASDICVLVKSRAKARLVEKLLAAAGIPHTFYKKRGLYQSDEAVHMTYLLEAIADPADIRAFKKALLTPFFATAPDEVERAAALPPTHPLKRLFQGWYGYATARKWPLLFQSILDDTGVLYADAADERRDTNYRQLCENLETDALTRSLDIVDLIALLERYRRIGDFDDETFDMQRLETEKPKVRIMTIHACKGLEFPVVFIADGFTERSAKSCGVWKYHDTEGRVVHDLLRRGDAQALFEAEREREYRHLFYVAATRARYKLYLPKFSGSGRADGPVSSVIREALRKAWPDDAQDGMLLRFVGIDGHDLCAEPALRVTVDKEKPAGADADRRCDPVVPEPLFPDLSFSFRGRMIEIDSYSGLKARLAVPSEKRASPDQSWIISYGSEMAGIKEADDDEPAAETADEDAPPFFAGILPDRPLFPPGAKTGSMLHEVLEGVDFRVVGAAVSPADLLADPATTLLIEEKLKKFGFIPAGGGPLFKEETARIIWQTLHAKLEPDGHVLWRATPEDSIRELEFYYPLSRRDPREAFVMGYIDLVYRFADRYYILDWKSNYLAAGYGPDAIRKSIEESGYELQYKVYSIAILRHLKATVKNFEYARHFGGIYYIYLRGMDPAKPGEGYVHIRPRDEAEIDGYERQIAALVDQDNGR